MPWWRDNPHFPWKPRWKYYDFKTGLGGVEFHVRFFLWKKCWFLLIWRGSKNEYLVLEMVEKISEGMDYSTQKIEIFRREMDSSTPWLFFTLIPFPWWFGINVCCQGIDNWWTFESTIGKKQMWSWREKTIVKKGTCFSRNKWQGVWYEFAFKWWKRSIFPWFLLKIAWGIHLRSIWTETTREKSHTSCLFWCSTSWATTIFDNKGSISDYTF